jgi:lipopolysaccharide transport system ATP-binding protein
MGDVASAGRTVLFVSHNLAAVTQLCDRAIWLQDGQIQRAGSAASVTEAYLSSGASQLPERHWSWPGDAPGDDRVRLVGCRVSQAGRTTSVLDINAPATIELEFEALQDLHDLIAGVNLYNAEGLCLLASCDWRPNQLQPGRYRKRVELPSQLLAEGLVSVLVQLVFYEPDVRSAVLPDALRFEAMDSDHPHSVRGRYKGDWPGAVRMYLNWSDACART